MPIILKDVPLFQGLNEEAIGHLQSALKEKTFSKGDLLFFEGAGCEKIIIVRTGRVKLFRTTSGGREQILEVLMPGDTCACNPGYSAWYCSASAQGLTAGSVWYLSRQDYIRLVQNNSGLTQTLNEVFAKRLQCFSDLIEEVSLKDVKKRLIKFLLDMLKKKKMGVQKNDSLFIPFTREEIAQRLGTARETVARYLTQLKKAKLIDIKPHQITILNKEGLQKLLQ